MWVMVVPPWESTKQDHPDVVRIHPYSPLAALEKRREILLSEGWTEQELDELPTPVLYYAAWENRW